MKLVTAAQFSLFVLLFYTGQQSSAHGANVIEDQASVPDIAVDYQDDNLVEASSDLDVSYEPPATEYSDTSDIDVEDEVLNECSTSDEENSTDSCSASGDSLCQTVCEFDRWSWVNPFCGWAMNRFKHILASASTFAPEPAFTDQTCAAESVARGFAPGIPCSIKVEVFTDKFTTVNCNGTVIYKLTTF